MSVYCEECGGSVHNRLCSQCEGKERRADNAKLRDYVQHKENCKLTLWRYDNTARRKAGLTEGATCPPCTCGLADLLKGNDDE